MRVGVVLLVLAVPGAALAQTEVRHVGDLVEVQATMAPLADILDRLARETGMKVVYDGAPPRARVRLALPAMPPAQAVLAVLEGQGLNYMARMDPTGLRVDTLYVVSGGGPATPATAARGESRPPGQTAADDDDEPEPAPEPVMAIERPERPNERLERIERERQERSQEQAEDEKPMRPGVPFPPGAMQPLMLPPGSGGVPGAPGPLRLPTRPAPGASPSVQQLQQQ